MLAYYYYIIIPLSIYVVYQILKLFGVFEFSKGDKVAKDRKKKEEHSRTERKFEKFKLNFFETLSQWTSFMFSQRQRDQHEYYIARLEKKSKVLNRSYTAEEYRGKFVFILFLGILSIPLFFISPIFLALPIASIVIFLYYPTICKNNIEDEDKIIDIYFTDLYLLMYSQLRRGSKGRIRNVVLSYQNSLQSLGESEKVRVMSKLTEYLLNNLMRESDDKAIESLKLRYKSALILNFCNVASQSLKGIDNYDTLLSYKMSLTQKKKSAMRKKADIQRKIGEYLIYAIFIILFEFILFSFISKVPNINNVM